MRKAGIATLLMMLGLFGPSAAWPAGFDGTTPFLCAAIQAVECEADGTCERRTVEDMNFPQFFRVDPKAKVVSANEPGGRTSPVQDMSTVDGKLVMHGGQRGRGWSAVVVGDTGKLTVTIADASGAFVIFGACTAH